MAKATPAEIARWLGNAWARYFREYLAEVDARSGDPGERISNVCGHFASAKRFLDAAVATGQYYSAPRNIRDPVEAIPEHVRSKHPEFAPLLDADPGPATLALRDQLDAVRRDAEAAYGKRPK